MNLPRSIAAVLLALFAQHACADGQALTGLGLQLAYGVASDRAQDSTIDDPDSINNYGGQSSLANVGVGYRQAFDQHFTVGSFLSHLNLGALLSVDLNSSALGGWKNATSAYELQLRQVKQLALEPGMTVGRNSLVYLLASYSRGELRVAYQAAGDSETGVSNVHAWGVGLGMRTQLSRHVSLGLEAQQLYFGDVIVEFPKHDLMLTEKAEQVRATFNLGIVF